MTHTDELAAVERRVFALRLNMTDALRVARVANSTWSRAKARGFIRPKTLRRVEDAVLYLERQAAADQVRVDAA